MNLAQIKTSGIAKRKLFQIERAIVREITDLWCKEKSYFDHNFAEKVEVITKGQRIDISFSNTGPMKYGSPEATIHEMMRGLILTMATNQSTGKLLKNHGAIIGNILDVFVHRLIETVDRKFIFQRLQSLELGFDIAFGLDKIYFPIKKARRYLEDALTTASLSTAGETADSLIRDMQETESLAQKERGVTFHIILEKGNEASFISLPLGMEQAPYVSLLGTHTLRCNILADLDHRAVIKKGILKIDAPTNPLKFAAHKGLELSLNASALMAKLRSATALTKQDFSPDELSFLKALFNEYVNLAAFLISSNKIDPGLRLLLIFPRVNIFSILHAVKKSIPADEPQTLQDLADLKRNIFKIQKSRSSKKRSSSKRISEKVIQEKIFEVIQAMSRYILQHIYKPLTDIKRSLVYYTQQNYDNPAQLQSIRSKTEAISSTLKQFRRIQHFALDGNGRDLDIEASSAERPAIETMDALDEIVVNIQMGEVDQIREVVVSKLLDYLSFISVRIEQLERVSTQYIKEEIVREMDGQTATMLLQAKSFYKLMMGNRN